MNFFLSILFFSLVVLVMLWVFKLFPPNILNMIHLIKLETNYFIDIFVFKNFFPIQKLFLNSI